MNPHYTKLRSRTDDRQATGHKTHGPDLGTMGAVARPLQPVQFHRGLRPAWACNAFKTLPITANNTVQLLAQPKNKHIPAGDRPRQEPVPACHATHI